MAKSALDVASGKAYICNSNSKFQRFSQVNKSNYTLFLEPVNFELRLTVLNFFAKFQLLLQHRKIAKAKKRVF